MTEDDIRAAITSLPTPTAEANWRFTDGKEWHKHRDDGRPRIFFEWGDDDTYLCVYAVADIPTHLRNDALYNLGQQHPLEHTS